MPVDNGGRGPNVTRAIAFLGRVYQMIVNGLRAGSPRPIYVLLVLGILLWLLFVTHLGKMLRAQYMASRVPGLREVTLEWKGNNIVARGRARDEADYVELSRVLARIVGRSFVINEVQIASNEPHVSPTERVGILTIAVNTRYDDSPSSLREIAEILRLPQFEIFNVTTDSTLSGVVLDRYRISVSELPRSYDLVAQRISELNALSDKDRIQIGPLKIPILPARARESLSLAPTHPGLTFYSMLTSGVMSPSISERAVVQPEAPNTPDAISMVSFPVTAASLEQTRRSLPRIVPEVSSIKMTVRFADAMVLARAGQVHGTLAPQGLSVLRSALRRKANRNATVFILDDGWPDAITYASSMQEVQRLSDITRDYYGLPHVKVMSSPFIQLPSATPHSSFIRDALKEFTDADTQGIVKVVYVPLSKSQNSSDMLTELLRLHYLERTAKKGSIDAPVLEAADSYAKAALSNIQDSFDDQKMDTDEAILQAIWSIADRVAMQSAGRDVFFINESWTVVSGTLEDAHKPISAGIAVAAAGNVPGKVVNSDIGGVDFARQCTSTKSVLAVLNVVPGKGLACNSSIVNEDVLPGSFVVAYDGEVLAGPKESKCIEGDVSQCVCGTSFSAPRVAWILALSEAERTKDVDYAVWNNLLETKLQKLRTQGGTAWDGLYLPVEQLLK